MNHPLHLFSMRMLSSKKRNNDEYLAIVEQEFLCELSAVAWKGFMWNLACFEKRASKELLYSDPEFRFGQEQLHEIPVLSELFAKDSAL